MELNAINPWLVRPANELKFSVPVCSSHVKRVLTRSDCADLDANDDFVLLRRCLPDPMWSVLPHVVMEARIACKQQVRGIRQSGYTPSVESIAAASSLARPTCCSLAFVSPAGGSMLAADTANPADGARHANWRNGLESHWSG